MKTPEPRSAFESLKELADQLQNTINELFQYSELRRDTQMATAYYQWYETDPRAGKARGEALRFFRMFEDELHLILSWHDPTNDQMHSFRAHEVFTIIDRRGHTQLASVDDARRAVNEYLSYGLRSVTDVPDRLEGACLVVPDTSVLIDHPTLEEYHLGLPKVIVVFTPIVIRELENHKRRRPKRDDSDDGLLWKNARTVVRRLKECGDVGDIRMGVPISDRVSVMAVAVEPQRETIQTDPSGQGLLAPQAYPPVPKRERLPAWLDLNVSDDRIIASALEVRREHPKAGIVVLSGDFNMLNKARQAGLLAFDAEEFFEKR